MSESIRGKRVLVTGCAEMSIFKQMTGWAPYVDLEHGIRLIIGYEEGRKRKDNDHEI